MTTADADNRPTPSPRQAAWEALVAAMRTAYAERVTDMATMTPAELEAFADAGRSIYWFAFAAATWDKKLELEEGRFSAD